MDFLKSWVNNVCIAVFFIVSIEIILPDNSLKKYARFVLGLILIVVISNPLLNFLARGEENLKAAFFQYSNKMDSLGENEVTKVNSNRNVELTLKNFENNIKNNCTSILSGKYPSMEFLVEVKGFYENNKYGIENISLGIKDKSIKKIKKVEINSSVAIKDNNEEYDYIKNFISGELYLNKDKIKIYNIDN